MSKQILFADSAREKMLQGMKVVADTVSITMGPKGRNVIFESQFGGPQVTNDGVTIAKEVELEDAFENMGASLVKDAADRANAVAGDGTTTATVLTYAIAKEGMRYIKSGVNAVELKNGLKEASQKVIEELISHSKPITTKEEIAQVATISAQDSQVGNIIAEAMEKVGNTGVISVKEGQTFGLSVDITMGMEFDSGYLSPYMVTNSEKMIAEMKDAPILMTDGKISNMQDMLPLLEAMMQAGKKDLVIFADDIDGEALTTIILNRMKGVLNILAIKNPGFGDNKKALLKDIAILTGSTIVASDLGMKLENVDMSHLGSAENIVASQSTTTIIGGKGNSSDIADRVAEIKTQITTTDSKYDAEKLQERLAKLDGGVAVIKVGAASEVEMKEKKLRIEDALNATRAAVEQGVVAGGGVALLKASRALEGMDLGNPDKNTGAEIIAKALKYPIYQIATNAGKEGSVVVNAVMEKNDENYGYDAANDTYVNMIESGIIDPAKVERVALEEAVSVSGMFLTTESAITAIPKPESDTAPSPAGMPGMGGMGMY
ncbi:chaperonin GroEL [Candidatus Gracilibacteria bacterium]|nr:chaperonin GroEL [Candidatus Gracilibacteria bacterium]